MAQATIVTMFVCIFQCIVITHIRTLTYIQKDIDSYETELAAYVYLYMFVSDPVATQPQLTEQSWLQVYIENEN